MNTKINLAGVELKNDSLRNLRFRNGIQRIC